MLYQVSLAKKPAIISGKAGIRANKVITKDGQEIPAGPYNGRVLPGVFKQYTPSFDAESGSFRFDMTQAEIDELVKDMQVYTEEGEQIVTAPLRSPGAAFWKQPKAFLRLDGAEGVLDDSTPEGRFFLSAMRADRRVHVRQVMKPGEATGTREPMPAMAEYVLQPVGLDAKKEVAKVDARMKATELLAALTFEKQMQILSAMGVVMRGTPDPDVVRSRLFTRVNDEGDRPFNGARGETNLEIFMRLAGSETSELVVRDVFTKALRKRGLISKSRAGSYTYGEMVLGRTQEESVKKLMTPDMSDILAELSSRVKEQ